MAEYKKSRETRQSILNASKKLFYENGYKDTRYNDIADESGINPGLIYYHFKTKSALGSIVYSDFMTSVKHEAERIYGEGYDLRLCTATELRIQWRLIFEDEKVQRFFYEAAKDRILIDGFRTTGEFFFNLHNDRYKLGFSSNQIRIINISTAATETELVIASKEDYLSMTQEELCDFDIFTVYQAMRTPYEKIDELQENSKAVADMYDIYLNDYFIVKTKPRKR